MVRADRGGAEELRLDDLHHHPRLRTGARQSHPLCCGRPSFLTAPPRSQNTGSQMIFQALPMQSKRVPDMIDAVKEILGIVDPDSDDDEDT